VTRPTRSLEVLEEERAVPWGDPELFAWHRARYELGLRYARGLRVLDVGSGEGYGTALLADTAAEVLGVDYSPAAVRHASEKYRRPNLRYELRDATDLAGLGEDRFDLVTCFEVIEHVANDDAFVRGIAHVLRPGGTLILSTPNNTLWRGPRSDGAYHVNNLSPRELRQLLAPHFDVVLYGQCVRGSRLHAALKAADVLNLRHRLVRSPRVKTAVAAPFGGPVHPQANGPRPEFRFSRLLVRQAQDTVAVARRRP
jgi:SAM-dependent methyltransferase